MSVQYPVLSNYNNHVAIVVKQTPKNTEYLVLSPAGPTLEKESTAKFLTEFYRQTKYLAHEAALRFLGASIRAYSFNEKAINILKEIVMTGPVTQDAQAVIEAATEPTAAQVANIEKKAKNAEKAKAARPKKDPSEVKPRGRGIGNFIKEKITAGDNNASILEAVKGQWPDAKTTVASIAWYRNDLKKKGA